MMIQMHTSQMLVYFWILPFGILKKYISKWLIIMYGIGLDVVTLHCDADPHCFIMARKEHPPYHVSEQRPTDE